jgi:hypothetical protein
MGLIHSRASKKNAKAQAKLANQQAKLVKAQTAEVENKATDHDSDVPDGTPWYLQPTIGAAVRAYRSRQVS